MEDPKYTTKGLPPPPTVSVATMAMGGLLVDVYGLDELPGDDEPVTCLWLLHPRARTRARMQDIARRTVHAWHEHSKQQQRRRRGLMALAFDMPNHGSRLVSAAANKTWQEGNERHALDMAAMIRAGRGDMSGLMDLAGAYLGRRVDAHVALGWSLGGHAAWQGVFCEDRLDAAVVVVGCPDFLGLMTERARKTGLDTGSSPLLGSKFFPPDLLATCAAHDPRAIMFGCDAAVPNALPPPPPEQARLRGILDARLRGKKVLACSGGDDALVPHARSAPLLALLKDAAQGWCRDDDGGAPFELDDRVYEGVGHWFSAAMVEDAVGFLVRVVDEGPRARGAERRARM